MKHISNLLYTLNIRWRLYISFVLVGMSMVWNNGEWLIFFGLIPLVSYVYRMGTLPKRKVVKDFYFGGFIVVGFANLFLFQVAPENWTIELTGWFGFASRLMSWILISSFCALSYGLMGYILTKIRSNPWRLTALALLFPLAELLRSYLFAIMAYGPHGSLSPNFNWGSIAVPASGTPLVYNSRFVGFFGLTLLVVIINICLYLIVIKRRVIVPFGLLYIIAVLTLFSWNMGRDLRDRSLKVAVVHLNEKSDVSVAGNVVWPPKDTDILVLPEYSGLAEYKDQVKLLRQLSPDGVAVTSIAQGRSPEGTNRVVYSNRQGTTIDAQDKTFLIPTGEHIPYSLQLGFRLLGKSQALQDFTYSQQLTPGKQAETPLVTSSGISIGTLACSGVSALGEYGRLSGGGAEVLANTASLAFLQSDSMYHVYARNMARYHAVSNNKPFLQSSRSGQSYILDNQGTTLSQSSGQTDQVLSSTIYIK